jgi:hypothetical protein
LAEERSRIGTERGIRWSRAYRIKRDEQDYPGKLNTGRYG